MGYSRIVGEPVVFGRSLKEAGLAGKLRVVLGEHRRNWKAPGERRRR